MISCYKPKKPFFKMNIKELQVYVNHCKNIDKKKKINKKLERKKTRSKRLRKTKKSTINFTRRKKKT